jgi:glycosyltransferase involved in cell wall biosynthesis
MKEMSSNPIVSICIPTFNRASMVSDAIQSALNQTYSPIEVLVVDNASTDNIDKVVRSFHDPRLKFVKNDKNLGLFGNFNRCIELAQGKYIHILHSDDWIDPDFTQICTRFLESNPDVVMTFTSLVLHTQGNQKLLTVSDKTEIYPPPSGFKQILLRQSFIGCPSVIVRREIYDTIGRFSLEYPYSADYYQWLKISRQYSIAYIRDASLHYRQGDHSESYRLLFASPNGYVDTIKIYIQLIQDLSDQYPSYRSDINVALRRFMKDCLFAGFTRSDQMDNFSPALFSGFAWNARGIIQPTSVSEHFHYFTDAIGIWISSLCMKFSLTRSLIGRVLKQRYKYY